MQEGQKIKQQRLPNSIIKTSKKKKIVLEKKKKRNTTHQEPPKNFSLFLCKKFNEVVINIIIEKPSYSSSS